MRTTPTKKRNAVLDYILELLQTNTFKYHLSVKSMISILHSDWKLSKKSHFNISRQKLYLFVGMAFVTLEMFEFSPQMFWFSNIVFYLIGNVVVNMYLYQQLSEQN